MYKRFKELLIISLVFGLLITSVLGLIGIIESSREADVMLIGGRTHTEGGFPFIYYEDYCGAICFDWNFYPVWFLLDLLIWSSLVGVGWYLLQRLQRKYE